MPFLLVFFFLFVKNYVVIAYLFTFANNFKPKYMQIDEDIFQDLDTKVYNFAVHVISFIKTLEKSGYYETVNLETLRIAGELAIKFPSYELSQEELKKELTEFYEQTEACFKLLTKVESHKFIDEKSNLLIEADRILKSIQKINE